MCAPPASIPRPLPEGLTAGTLVAGKFRLEKLLGEGGLVFAATHIELDERVALNFMRTEMMHNADIVERFAQEARAAARLKTEHVARVLDVGRHGDTPFMVIELLQGRDMQRLVIDDGPMPVDLAVELTIQACEALAEAHGRGIVHRDVKPENLFVVERDGMQHLKVLDFGISKVALSGKISDVDLTSRRTMSIMGSPYYMSPEQIRSTRDVDHRADIWSLGASLFECLTGRTAFPDGREFTELMFDIVQAPHRRLRELRPDIPPGLEAVIDRCLAKAREDRFQTVGDLAVALLPYTRNRARAVAERAVTLTRTSGLDPHIAMPPTVPPAGAGSIAPLDSTSLPALRAALVPSFQSAASITMPTVPVAAEPSVAPTAPTRRRPVLWIAGAGGALVVVLLLAWGLSRTSTVPTTSTTPDASTAPERHAQVAPDPATIVPDAQTPGSAAPPLAPMPTASAAKHPPPAHPAAPSKPAGTPRQPNSPSNPDLEIRRER